MSVVCLSMHSQAKKGEIQNSFAKHNLATKSTTHSCVHIIRLVGWQNPGTGKRSLLALWNRFRYRLRAFSRRDVLSSGITKTYFVSRVTDSTLQHKMRDKSAHRDANCRRVSTRVNMYVNFIHIGVLCTCAYKKNLNV